MGKQVAKTDKQSRFESARQRMREYNDAYWDAMFEIWDGQLWENEYDSFEEFVSAETDFSRRRVFQRLAAERVKRLSGVQKLHSDKLKSSHFEEVAKVDDPKTQVDVIKTVLEKCEEEEREPTTKDFRKEIKQRMPEPEANGKAHEPETEREPGEDDDKPLWVAGIAVVDGIRRQINELIKAVKDFKESPGTEMLATNRNRIVLDLTNAKNAIAGCCPHEACPYCNGIGAACEGCKQRGWVNSIDWKQAPPELKKSTDLVLTT